MGKYVVINANAEGYYSGKIHNEDVVLTFDIFNKYKEEILNLELYIAELDGKHSECKAEISIEHCDEYVDADIIYDSLYWQILNMIDVEDIELRKIQKEFESTNTYKYCSMKVHNDDWGKFEEFIKTIRVVR